MLEPIQDNDIYKPHANIIQIYPCLLKLSRKQESVMDGHRQTSAITISPHRYRGGGDKNLLQYFRQYFSVKFNGQNYIQFRLTVN